MRVHERTLCHKEPHARDKMLPELTPDPPIGMYAVWASTMSDFDVGSGHPRCQSLPSMCFGGSRGCAECAHNFEEAYLSPNFEFLRTV